jgi:hypothetical protein
MSPAASETLQQRNRRLELNFLIILQLIASDFDINFPSLDGKSR